MIWVENKGLRRRNRVWFGKFCLHQKECCLGRNKWCRVEKRIQGRVMVEKCSLGRKKAVWVVPRSKNVAKCSLGFEMPVGCNNDVGAMFGSKYNV